MGGRYVDTVGPHAGNCYQREVDWERTHSGFVHRQPPIAGRGSGMAACSRQGRTMAGEREDQGSPRCTICSSPLQGFQSIFFFKICLKPLSGAFFSLADFRAFKALFFNPLFGALYSRKFVDCTVTRGVQSSSKRAKGHAGPCQVLEYNTQARGPRMRVYTDPRDAVHAGQGQEGQEEGCTRWRGCDCCACGRCREEDGYRGQGPGRACPPTAAPP